MCVIALTVRNVSIVACAPSCPCTHTGRRAASNGRLLLALQGVRRTAYESPASCSCCCAVNCMGGDSGRQVALRARACLKSARSCHVPPCKHKRGLQVSS